MKIAACVILYHPKEKDLQNITTYLSKVDKLYIYDNTENVSKGQDLKNNPKINYFSEYENKGIATRLNQACEQAILDGYDLLLTMDQDSSFLEKKLDQYLELISNYPEIDNVAQFGLEYSDQENIEDKDLQIHSIENYDLITSASILVLKNFKTIGGFDENLFIDGVDFDYCLAAKKKGFKCFLFKNLIFVHSVGAKIKRRSFKTLYLLKKEKYLCSPIRIYYLVRNTLYLKDKYEAIFPEYITKLVKANNSSINTNRNYSRNIFEFYKYKRKAISDFKNKKMGKIYS